MKIFSFCSKAFPDNYQAQMKRAMSNSTMKHGLKQFAIKRDDRALIKPIRL